MGLGRIRSVAAESLRVGQQLLILGRVADIGFIVKARSQAQLYGLFRTLAAE